jgi:glycosyltransferase involved in cell wall biosynthesis
LCYRSEEAIIDFAKEAQQLAASLTNSYEIVLVGNYFEDSDDRTKDFVQQLAKEDNHFKAVCKPKEGMMGWDMREGLKNGSGKYLCVIDGDGQFPIDSIAQCYKEIKTGNYGLVKTYRSVRNDGIYRKTISMVYNLLFTILFPYVKAKDINSKPKIITRKVYEEMKLTSDDWFIDAEIMINIGKMKIPIHEFPIEFKELNDRKSFVKVAAIFEFIRNLIQFRFGNR